MLLKLQENLSWLYRSMYVCMYVCIYVWVYIYTHTHIYTHTCTLLGEGNGNLLQHSCLENSMDRRAWQATVHGVTKSWTWLSDWACTFISWKKYIKEMIPRDHWGLLQSTKHVVHTWVDLLPLISQASLAKDGESGQTRICLRRWFVAGAMGSKSSFRSVVHTVCFEVKTGESSLVVTDIQNPWYSLLLHASVVKRHRL